MALAKPGLCNQGPWCLVNSYSPFPREFDPLLWNSSPGWGPTMNATTSQDQHVTNFPVASLCQSITAAVPPASLKFLLPSLLWTTLKHVLTLPCTDRLPLLLFLHFLNFPKSASQITNATLLPSRVFTYLALFLGGRGLRSGHCRVCVRKLGW